MSDMMYQEAIEANFSHEQMTPLNCILGNSKIVKQDLHYSMKKIFKKFVNTDTNPDLVKELEKVDKNTSLCRSI
jgi:hypothetical protein